MSRYRTPINACGDKLFFWQEGNNEQAKTNVDENFNIVKNLDRSKKLLTYAYWRKNLEQREGYTKVGWGPDYDYDFILFPDGSTPQYPYCLPSQYKGAKFVPLNKQEMDYVQSKVMLAPDADNIVEYRYYSCLEGIERSTTAYYIDTSTGEMVDWPIELFEYSPEENCYMLSENWRGVDAIFNKNLRPATKEELTDKIAKAKQEDEKAVNYAKDHARKLPRLASEYCAEARQEYLDGINNHNNGSNDSPAQTEKGRQF